VVSFVPCGETSRLFEIARVLVSFNHVARFIVNANHSAMRAAEKPLAAKTQAQSTGNIITFRTPTRAIRGHRANGLTPKECFAFGAWQQDQIADNLSQAGWSYGYVSTLDSRGRTIWIADAHRDDGKRFILHADEKLTACVELEAAVRTCAELA
jgi:hypothetical protein